MIVLAPDPILSKKSEPVTKFDRSLHDLIRSMWSALESPGTFGVGLAAVQIGILKRVIVLDTTRISNPKHGRWAYKPMRAAIINPTFEPLPCIVGELVAPEGCLSFPGQEYSVKRHQYIKVKYQNLAGKEVIVNLGGLNAIAFQHEYDHIEGITMKDRATNEAISEEP